jgi:hypothetical protein
MLRELAPDDDDDDEDEQDQAHARPVMRDQYAASSYPPQQAESEGERRERLQQEEMDREEVQRQQQSQAAPFVLGEPLDVHTPPAAHTRDPLHVQAEQGNRSSLEGTGWRAVA